MPTFVNVDCNKEKEEKKVEDGFLSQACENCVLLIAIY